MPTTTDADVRIEKFKLWGLILTALVGPVVAFFLAKASADGNHAQSAKGYEVLATMVNQHEQRLDTIEKVLLRVEQQTKAASQPAVNLTGPIIVPGARVDPWPHVVAKAPAKAPLVAKAPSKTVVVPCSKHGYVEDEHGNCVWPTKAVVVANPKYTLVPLPAPASMPVHRAPMKAPRQLKDVR